MSTPCITEFWDDDYNIAVVYRHWDGDPAEAGKDLLRFMELDAQAGSRVGDAPYLSARYVAFLAATEFCKDPDNPANFTGVGIVQPGQDLGQYYTYVVKDDGEVFYHDGDDNLIPLTKEVVESS